jgi:hypothetical protein
MSVAYYVDRPFKVFVIVIVAKHIQVVPGGKTAGILCTGRSRSRASASSRT